MVRIAAAGDVHASEATRERITESFAAVQTDADLVLLAGDLTTHGESEQAEALAAACRGLEIPVCAVLGNHDHHAGRGAEVAAILRGAGVTLLEREATVLELVRAEDWTALTTIAKEARSNRVNGRRLEMRLRVLVNRALRRASNVLPFARR